MSIFQFFDLFFMVFDRYILRVLLAGLLLCLLRLWIFTFLGFSGLLFLLFEFFFLIESIIINDFLKSYDLMDDSVRQDVPVVSDGIREP